MSKHAPILYQINTRIWLKRFRSTAKSVSGLVTLDQVPSAYWAGLAKQGVDYIWLMGVWSVAPSAVAEYCFDPGLVDEYKKALPDWQPEDVAGSPYAIDQYRLNPILGSPEALSAVRAELNRLGLKLILDFVPNHFSAHSRYLESNPGAFIQGTDADLQRDSYTFYHPSHLKDVKDAAVRNRIFAHGRDPYFVPWQDTVQVNYASAEAQEFMSERLLEVARQCDGVRCDMAMLVLRDTFMNTWRPHAKLSEPPEGEFWQRAIDRVRSVQPEFLFIAESYWDMEPHLHRLGFDYTYDKGLMDALIEHPGAVKQRLKREIPPIQDGVHFLENHDEARAMVTFGEQRSLAAAVIISTLPGMRFFHDGQFEGRRVRVPVQLSREPLEDVNPRTKEFYDRLLPMVSRPLFRLGSFKMVEPYSCSDGDNGHERLLSWARELDSGSSSEVALVVVNYSEHEACARFSWIWSSAKTSGDTLIEFTDLIDGAQYAYTVSQLINEGLFVLLKPYQCHILYFSWQKE